MGHVKFVEDSQLLFGPFLNPLIRLKSLENYSYEPTIVSESWYFTITTNEDKALLL